MICTKCKAELVQSTNFCPNCGKKLVHSTKKRRAKSRGNGTGCAYYDSVHRYWVAQIVDGYRELPPFSLDNPDNRKQMVPQKDQGRIQKAGRCAGVLFCAEKRPPEAGSRPDADGILVSVQGREICHFIAVKTAGIQDSVEEAGIHQQCEY